MNAATTAAAAAAARARQRQEEESMSPYDANELAEGWEFKILRSATGMFKHPEKLRAVLAEEARGGWVLLEKLDNGRIRLKRPASAKKGDSSLRFDAYRTTIGVSESGLAGIIVAVVLGVVAGGLLLALALGRS